MTSFDEEIAYVRRKLSEGREGQALACLTDLLINVREIALRTKADHEALDEKFAGHRHEVPGSLAEIFDNRTGGPL